MEEEDERRNDKKEGVPPPLGSGSGSGTVSLAFLTFPCRTWNSSLKSTTKTSRSCVANPKIEKISVSESLLTDGAGYALRPCVSLWSSPNASLSF
eukprot:5969201-Pyramimonas_sp.AAC.1